MQRLDHRGELIEATEVPGGWIGPVRTKPPNQYLSSAIWVGDATPEWSMGAPFGLGGECVFATGYEAFDDSPKGWLRKRTFASVDPDLLIPAATEWLASIAQEAS